MTLWASAGLITFLLLLVGSTLGYTLRRTSRRVQAEAFAAPLAHFWPLAGLLLTAALLVLLPSVPVSDAEQRAWQIAGTTLAFSLLFPQLLVCVRQFTLIDIPHWRSLRAFAFGVSALVGIDAIGLALTGAAAEALPPVALVGYVLAACTASLALWRLVSTPRQRWLLVLLATIPLALVGADMMSRLGRAQWLGQPLLSWAILASALTLASLRTRTLSIRPIARSALVDQVQDALLVIDAQQTVVDFNQAFASLFPGEPLFGRKGTKLLPPAVSGCLAASTQTQQIAPWERNGSTQWFEVQQTPLALGDQPGGTLLTFRDVTRRRRAEEALQASRAELEAANAALERLALTDPLTGLDNRRSLLKRLEVEASRHHRSGLTLGTMIIDLDHFKTINDQHGHPAGDAVLKAVAERIRQICRETDMTARLGGEEFAVIAVDSSLEGPGLLAERLRQGIANLRIPVDEVVELTVTASLGVAVHHGSAATPDLLLKLADDALYKAKHQGRNRVVVDHFASEQHSAKCRRLSPPTRPH